MLMMAIVAACVGAGSAFAPALVPANVPGYHLGALALSSLVSARAVVIEIADTNPAHAPSFCLFVRLLSIRGTQSHFADPN